MIRSYKIIVLLFIVISGVSVCKSQWVEDVYLVNEEKHHKDDLFLTLDNFNHFADQEFYNRMTYSYTIAGYHLKPSLNYQISDDFSVGGGVYFMNLLGRDKPWMIKPVFLLKYNVFSDLNLRFGNIKGGMEHRLSEQIYSYRQSFEQFNEEGLQARFINEDLFFDVWLDWRFLTIPNDNQPERIFGGYNIKYRFVKADASELKVCTEMVAWHNGGQDLDVDRDLRTILNFTGGMKYKYTFNTDLSGALKVYYSHFENVIPQDVLPYNRGYGLTSELQIAYKKFQLKTGYWYSDSFYAPLGNYIFGAVSEKYSNFYHKSRDVIFSHFKYEKIISEGLKGGFRTGMYNSLNLNKTDFYFTLLVRFNKNFFLNE